MDKQPFWRDLKRASDCLNESLNAVYRTSDVTVRDGYVDEFLGIVRTMLLDIGATLAEYERHQHYYNPQGEESFRTSEPLEGRP